MSLVARCWCNEDCHLYLGRSSLGEGGGGYLKAYDQIKNQDKFLWITEGLVGEEVEKWKKDRFEADGKVTWQTVDGGVTLSLPRNVWRCWRSDRIWVRDKSLTVTDIPLPAPLPPLPLPSPTVFQVIIYLTNPLPTGSGFTSFRGLMLAIFPPSFLCVVKIILLLYRHLSSV